MEKFELEDKRKQSYSGYFLKSFSKLLKHFPMEIVLPARSCEGMDVA